ncbi:MAG TPA: hypothetical protein VES20_20560, partial [Bryobacteraceae bacterium]|nr:hypothetical protein [Bryobacteraceae bacterium]
EGYPKLNLIMKALEVRRACPRAFGRDSRYEALRASGSKADHLVAFLRNGEVLTAGTRFPIGLRVGWRDTKILLPPGEWRNVLTNDSIPAGEVLATNLFRPLPVALLVRHV